MKTMSPKRKKARGKKSKPLTPEQLLERERKRDQKAYEKRVRSIFIRSGYLRIPSNGIEICFDGRTGEIDDIFICENVIILAEYYTGAPDAKHIFSKKILYDKILENIEGFISLARTKYALFGQSLKEVYSISDFIIKIVYATKNDPSQEVVDSCGDIILLYGTNEKYFTALTSTIEATSRYELLKFLGIKYSDFSMCCLKSSAQTTQFSGFLLPEGESCYPSGYRIVSFYADPESLMGLCYVLRRDGWREDPYLYQRVLVKEKIRKMRAYLSREKRVYVNNIIATLPGNTAINAIEQPGKNLSISDQKRVKPVTISIPNEYDSVGVIDGQHRIFCYHDGTDKHEPNISLLRKKQTFLSLELCIQTVLHKLRNAN